MKYIIHKKIKYNKNVTNTAYKLIYTYVIYGKEYSIKTDYGSRTVSNINRLEKQNIILITLTKLF